MEQFKLKANEEFFDMVIRSLKDGGCWGWPDEMEFFTKKNGKLCGSKKALYKVMHIVSNEYFNEKFEIQ